MSASHSLLSQTGDLLVTCRPMSRLHKLVTHWDNRDASCYLQHQNEGFHSPQLPDLYLSFVSSSCTNHQARLTPSCHRRYCGTTIRRSLDAGGYSLRNGASHEKSMDQSDALVGRHVLCCLEHGQSSRKASVQVHDEDGGRHLVDGRSCSRAASRPLFPGLNPQPRIAQLSML